MCETLVHVCVAVCMCTRRSETGANKLINDVTTHDAELQGVLAKSKNHEAKLEQTRNAVANCEVRLAEATERLNLKDSARELAEVARALKELAVARKQAAVRRGGARVAVADADVDAGWCVCVRRLSRQPAVTV